MFEIRQAVPSDAAAMDAVLTPILERWGSDRPRGADQVRRHYITHPDGLSCCIAEDAARIVGFQALKRAMPGNPYDLPKGWGIIGTYVAADAAGRGVGRAMFRVSRAVAERAGLARIDATIGETNAEGLAYYAKMGFREWRTLPGAVGMAFDLDPGLTR